MAKMLFDILENKACSIFDAIYRFAQKLKNFLEQKLWSEQKKCGVNRKNTLIKLVVECIPVIITFCTFCTFVFRPFDANHNDATILEDCFNKYEDKMNTRCYNVSY